MSFNPNVGIMSITPSARSDAQAPSPPHHNMTILPGSPNSRPVASQGHAQSPTGSLSMTPTRQRWSPQVDLPTNVPSSTPPQTPPRQSQPLLGQAHTEPHIATYDAEFDMQMWTMNNKRAFAATSAHRGEHVTKRPKLAQFGVYGPAAVSTKNLFEIGTTVRMPKMVLEIPALKKPHGSRTVSFSSDTTDNYDDASISMASSTAGSSVASSTASSTTSLISVASRTAVKQQDKEKDVNENAGKTKGKGKNERILEHLLYAKDLPNKPRFPFEIRNSDSHGPFIMSPDKMNPIYKPSSHFWPTRSELAAWKKSKLLKPKVEGEDIGIPPVGNKGAEGDVSVNSDAEVDELARKVYDAIIDVKFFYAGIKAPVTHLLNQDIEPEALIAMSYDIVKAAIKYHTEGFELPVWAQLSSNHPRGRKKEQDNSFKKRMENIILALRHHKNVVMDAVEGKTSLFYALIIAPLASFQAKAEWAKSNHERGVALKDAKSKSKQFEEAQKAQMAAAAQAAEVASEDGDDAGNPTEQ